MIVRIDTTDNKAITVSLVKGEKEIVKKQQLDTRKAQVVLPMLEQLLHERNVQLQDLTGIEVNPGPGSFTGIRVGITIANTLGFLLQIPVNGRNPGIPEEAVYSPH